MFFCNVESLSIIQKTDLSHLFDFPVRAGLRDPGVEDEDVLVKLGNHLGDQGYKFSTEYIFPPLSNSF